MDRQSTRITHFVLQKLNYNMCVLCGIGIAFSTAHNNLVGEFGTSFYPNVTGSLLSQIRLSSVCRL